MRIKNMSTTKSRPQSPLFGTLQAAHSVTGTYMDVPGASSPYTKALNGPQEYFCLLLEQREDNL